MIRGARDISWPAIVLGLLLLVAAAAAPQAYQRRQLVRPQPALVALPLAIEVLMTPIDEELLAIERLASAPKPAELRAPVAAYVEPSPPIAAGVLAVSMGIDAYKSAIALSAPVETAPVETAPIETAPGELPGVDAGLDASNPLRAGGEGPSYSPGDTQPQRRETNPDIVAPEAGASPDLGSRGVDPAVEPIGMETSSLAAPEPSRALAYIPAPSPAVAPVERFPRPYAPEAPMPPSTSIPTGIPTGSPEVAARSAPSVPFAWQLPRVLVDELDSLTKTSASRAWAEESRQAIVALGEAMATDAVKAAHLLDRLEQLEEEAVALANAFDDRHLARRVRQAGYGLSRRLDVWRQVAEIDAVEGSPSRVAHHRQADLAVCLASIDSLTLDSSEGRAWREYLMLDALQSQMTRADVSEELARELLARLHHRQLTPSQQQFLSSRPVAALELAMRRASTEPVDVASVLADVERYEETRLASDGQQVAADCQSLVLSPYEEHKQLGRKIEMHYRNANVRMAVSEKLINRLVPQPSPEMMPVYDTVQGVPLVGQSLVTSDVALRMMPDANRIRLALEVNGEVTSFTSSSAGPATFYNQGNTVYSARKPMEIDLRGVRLEPTQVNVYSNSRLQDLETDFDAVPLVGVVVNRLARQQHEQHKPAAEREIRWKISSRARHKVDTEAAEKFANATTALQDKVVKPLEAMELEPRLISAETTTDRIAMRVRLAGADQLGSHTARPQAPSDSLASLQVHESAINNAIDRLELDGRTFTLPELRKHVAARLQRFEVFEADEDDDDVSITFAERDAVNVQFQDGQVVVNVSIAQLSKPPRSWKDFKVRAYYKPEMHGQVAELSRDGIIRLEDVSQRLNTGGQLALRSVFSKVFSRGSKWTVTPEALAKRPEFADLGITQFIIDDGWIGVAVGPKRTATWLRPGLLVR